MAQLIVTALAGNSTTHELAGLTTIGRHQDNDVILDDGSVSGHHAKIDEDDGDFILRDLNSSNGTTVNGQRITTIKLNEDDMVGFGTVKCVFKATQTFEHQRPQRGSSSRRNLAIAAIVAVALVALLWVVRPHPKSASVAATSSDPSSPTSNSSPDLSQVPDSDSKTSALSTYAAQVLPSAVQMPQIVVSGSLENLGFTASIRTPENQKELKALVDSNNWLGVAALVIGQKPNAMSDVDLAKMALKGGGGVDAGYSLPVALQSSKGTFTSDPGDDQRPHVTIGVVELPHESNAITLNAQGEFDSPVFFRGGVLQNPFPQHPSGNGFLDQLHFGDYTAYYFQDSLNSDAATAVPGGLIASKIHSLKDQLSRISKSKEIGDLDANGAKAAAVAAEKDFEKTIIPILLQKQ